MSGRHREIVEQNQIVQPDEYREAGKGAVFFERKDFHTPFPLFFDEEGKRLSLGGRKGRKIQGFDGIELRGIVRRNEFHVASFSDVFRGGVIGADFS